MVINMSLMNQWEVILSSFVGEVPATLSWVNGEVEVFVGDGINYSRIPYEVKSLVCKGKICIMVGKHVDVRTMYFKFIDEESAFLFVCSFG
jgi:hypothetical protein